MTSNDQNLPLVTTVIPTRNRPDLVCRALRSALAQTYTNLEVVVVIDGPDPATVHALHSLGDERVKVVALEHNVGGSEARNIGVREAHGQFIALLDDDDEWLPEKLELQVLASHDMSGDFIVVTQYEERGSHGSRIRPNRGPRPGEPISEYLFCTVSPLKVRDGFLQTSTWFVPAMLLKRVPFTPGLKKNQDTDWLLRACIDQRVRVKLLPRVLAVFHNQETIGRVSRTQDWEFNLNWSTRNRHFFTKRSLSYFLATQCLPDAVSTHAGLRTIARLLWACHSLGTVSLGIWWLFMKSVIVIPLVKKVFPASATVRTKQLLYR